MKGAENKSLFLLDRHEYKIQSSTKFYKNEEFVVLFSIVNSVQTPTPLLLTSIAFSILASMGSLLNKGASPCSWYHYHLFVQQQC